MRPLLSCILLIVAVDTHNITHCCVRYIKTSRLQPMKTPRTPTNEDLKNIQPMLLQGFGDRSARSILVLDFRRASRMSDLSSASLLQCAVLSRSQMSLVIALPPPQALSTSAELFESGCKMNWLACALLRGSIATVMVLSSNPSQALLSSAYASLSSAWSSFVPRTRRKRKCTQELECKCQVGPHSGA